MAKRKEDTSTLASKRAAEQRPAPGTPLERRRVFERVNYYIMLGGAILLVIGFLLMLGGKQDPEQFNYDEIYSFRRITLSPIIIVISYILIIIGILWRPKRDAAEKINS